MKSPETRPQKVPSSGSGKSSVVRAGLLPALRRGALSGSDDWRIAEMFPGAHPLEQLEAALLRERFAPPAPEEILNQVGSPAARAVWEALLDHATVVRVAEGICFHRTALDAVTQLVRDYLAREGKMTASAFRDLIGSSRKYAVPLLEYLDATRITRRVGDERILF